MPSGSCSGIPTDVSEQTLKVDIHYIQPKLTRAGSLCIELTSWLHCRNRNSHASGFTSASYILLVKHSPSTHTHIPPPLQTRQAAKSLTTRYTPYSAKSKSTGQISLGRILHPEFGCRDAALIFSFDILLCSTSFNHPVCQRLIN